MCKGLESILNCQAPLKDLWLLMLSFLLDDLNIQQKNNTKRLDGRLGYFHKTPSITGRYNQLPSQSHAC